LKIVVCVKAVPGQVSDIKVAAGGKGLEYQSQFHSMNECDESALEEAVYLKKTYGGEVTALTMGSIKTMDILYTAIAKGADKVVRVDAQPQDAQASATILAAVLKQLAPDLILTGTQSRDTLSGAVGILAAEKLDLPFAYAVTKIEKDAPDSVKVRKELGGGRFADVRLPLPALACVQTGIQPISFVPPARMMRARQTAPKSYSLADLGISDDQAQTKAYAIESVFPPVRVGKVDLIEGAAPDVAAKLLARIREVL
jgi:electron transfer flavoprotein beta subunit